MQTLQWLSTGCSQIAKVLRWLTVGRRRYTIGRPPLILANPRAAHDRGVTARMARPRRSKNLHISSGDFAAQ